MEDERYPADLPITVQDFQDCGWEDLLAKSSREGYPSMWQALSAAARQAIDAGRQTQGKVLWLLADACSMMLQPESVNEPFKPFMVIQGRRSAIPDDLSVADVEFFAQVVPGLDDPWLKARLADLVWLNRVKHDVQFALMAIDAYRRIPLDTETWVRGGHQCWERAIRLAFMLRRGAGNRIAEIETAIFNAFNKATMQDGYLALWLAELMDKNGLSYSEHAVVARKLETLAGEFESAGDVDRARAFFGLAASWFKKGEDEAKAASITVSEAECWVKEAVARISVDKPSYIAASTFYENAIQIYRTIPHTQRAALHVDERIAELRTRMNECSEKSLGEMGVIQSPTIDISEMVEKARQAVSGKEVIEALKAFCNLHRGMDIKKAKADALKQLRDHPLQGLLSATIVSREGRVIAKRPGLSADGASPEEDETTIRAEMIRNYGMLLGLVVQGEIFPALQVLWVEHRLHERDFVGLASQSPAVPKGRAQLFGKALFAGYDGDFIAALHLLVPQIENMVRHHLKQVGVKTTTLDASGVENEIGLSALMEIPEAEKVFGADLAFEIRALFCDPFGPNLRNELAHGLLDDQACQSAYSIYAWWFGLKLAFNTFWNAAKRSTPNSSTSQECEGGQVHA